VRAAAIICIILATAFASHAADNADSSQPVPAVVPGPPSDHLDRALPGSNYAPLIRYHDSLRELFKDAFSKGVQVRMLAEPSFDPEYAVAIVTTEHGFRVLFVGAPENTWYTERKSLEVNRCQADLNAALALRVIDVWKRMISAVPVDGPARRGLDGDEYYFSVVDAEGEHMAQTWSPTGGTEPAMLVKLASTLAKFCRSQRWSLLLPISWYYASSISSQVTELNARLDADARVR
jgi:hypothetical protein